jgi:hypothetical protein
MFTKWHLCHEISIFCTRYLILEARKARRYLCAKRGRTRGATSERDSSGTTKRRASGAKVMERIARREPQRGEAARPKTYFIIRPQKVGWRLAR